MKIMVMKQVDNGVVTVEIMEIFMGLTTTSHKNLQALLHYWLVKKEIDMVQI